MHQQADMICQKFAQSFRHHRWRLGISRDELADACGFSVSIQKKWEQGVCCPTLFCLVAMADYMNLSLDELVGRERRGG